VGVLCIRSILSVFPSDLPGVNLATLNGMILYCRLMTKCSGLGDSTELSRIGLSHWAFDLIEDCPSKWGRYCIRQNGRIMISEEEYD
jgi:hypothetical protein